MTPATTRYIPPGLAPFILHGLAEDQTVFAQIAQTGTWEPHVLAALQRVIRPEFVCLDVGANIGAITLVLARLAHRGSVHAFEASAQAAALLRKNVTDNGLANVTVVERAVSRRSGEVVELYTVPDQLGTAHLSDHLGRDGHMQRVETISLDDYPISRVDFIKLDVEGAEIPALAGARGMIARDRPMLTIEYNPAPAAWFAQASKRALYDLLAEIYPNISIIRAAGALEAVTSWDVLDSALPEGTWCDLLCWA